MYKRLEAIVNRCRNLLDKYGAQGEHDTRTLRVAGYGEIAEHKDYITIWDYPYRHLEIDLTHGLRPGYIPKMSNLNAIIELLDQIEEPIKEVQAFLESE